MLVLRVGRCERRTSLTVNVGCWHALPMGIHATLMLAPGCSPWRPKSEPRLLPVSSRTVGGGADMRRASNRPGRELDLCGDCLNFVPNWLFCRLGEPAPVPRFAFGSRCRRAARPGSQDAAAAGG